MSQTKPEHPPENTPTADAESATGALDRESKRKHREDIRQYETKRVQPGPADSDRVAVYKTKTDEAAKKVMELLRDDPRCLDVFRERIRFAVVPYDDYERQREEENRRQTKQRNTDLAAATRDRKRRDKEAKPPSEEYSWVRSEGCWMRRFAHADIRPAPWLQAILDREGFDDQSKWLPAYYGILVAIHDKHPDCDESISKPVWPDFLLDHVWRLLDPLHGLAATTIENAVKAVERDLAATIEPKPSEIGGKETAWSGTAVRYEVPWDEENRDYMQCAQARVRYTASRLPASTLSRKLGLIPVHFMRRPGKGSRVHEREFEAWARQEYPEANLTDQQRAEIADEVAAEREVAKACMRRK